ncbi:exonuclease domain-containing protein [Buchananella felis]|uniref:exonuclease domain-containing protein n=1 Tax=Buchananella felis TaxID=3231492 RepID=UPI003526F156
MDFQGVLVGFDTETTGVDTGSDRIVTAAVVVRSPGRPDEVLTWLADPGVEIPQAASDVHGITTEYARAHGRPAAQVVEEVAAVLAALVSSGGTIVAFNASFDLAILREELHRYGLPTLEERLGGELRAVLDPLVIDRAVDRWRKGKRTLGSLVEHYGIAAPQGDLHTADVDVAATLDVLGAILTQYPEVGARSEAERFEWQRQAHREWAESFNKWLRRQGRDNNLASTQWP